MKVRAVKCLSCGQTIYSRAKHDFHSCKCGNISVDGGFDYFRVLALDSKKIEDVELAVDATRAQLFEDWQREDDKFGVIDNED